MWSVHAAVTACSAECQVGDTKVSVWISGAGEEVWRRSECCDSSEWPSVLCELAHEVPGFATRRLDGLSG